MANDKSAIERARDFAGQINSAIDPKVEALLSGQWDGEREGVVDLGDMQGLTPDDPIYSSLGDHVGNVVSIIHVEMIENQFANDRPEASPWSAVIVFQKGDGLFYRVVGSNALLLKQYPKIERALFGYEAVVATVIGVEVKGQVNKAYGFASAKGFGR